MDFDLTDEQRLLKDSVDRLIADQYQFEQRKKYMAEPDGWSRAVWQQYAEIGLLGLPFAEAHGMAPAIGLRHVLLPLLELILIGDQPIDAVLQQTLFIGQIEVHQRSLVAPSTVDELFSVQIDRR